jgi:hypothetical protein
MVDKKLKTIIAQMDEKLSFYEIKSKSIALRAVDIVLRITKIHLNLCLVNALFIAAYLGPRAALAWPPVYLHNSTWTVQQRGELSCTQRSK